MKKIAISVILILLLVGCNHLPTQPTNVYRPKTPINLPPAQAYVLEDATWYTVTPENVDAVFEKLKEDNLDLVLFAVDENGWEKLDLNREKLEQHIRQLLQNLEKTKTYYETP